MHLCGTRSCSFEGFLPDHVQGDLIQMHLRGTQSCAFEGFLPDHVQGTACFVFQSNDNSSDNVLMLPSP